MKLLFKDIGRDGGGTVSILPEDAEDMWHVFNMVSTGDSVRCSTIRKVQTESSSGTTSSNRLRLTLTVSVETIDYDMHDCCLRVKGRNIQENQHVKMGAYHTLDIQPNFKFSLRKDYWDSVCLERLDFACDPSKSADLAAVVMQEGLAHVCLITPSMTLVKTKIEVAIPRKRRGHCSQHDKEQFVQYMESQAVKQELRVIIENKSKFVQAHSSSGFKHSLNEVLGDPALSNRLANTKAAGEVRILEDFYRMMNNDPDRAFYGFNAVRHAVENQAVEVLLITDALFRNPDVYKRKQYVEIVENVKDSSGDVRIFSSLHVSGERLAQLTGIAALLRFPMPDLAEFDSEDEN